MSSCCEFAVIKLSFKGCPKKTPRFIVENEEIVGQDPPEPKNPGGDETSILGFGGPT